MSGPDDFEEAVAEALAAEADQAGRKADGKNPAEALGEIKRRITEGDG